MLLPPISEWPVNLHVSEAFVPAKVLDANSPRNTDRRERCSAKAYLHTRAVARCDADARCARGWSGRGLHLDLIDARVLPSGQQRGQIAGMNKEREDNLGRKWQPL